MICQGARGIANNSAGEENTPVYRGSSTTAEIDANKVEWANSLVFDTDQSKLFYIKKEQTETDYKVEIPVSSGGGGATPTAELTMTINEGDTVTINIV